MTSIFKKSITYIVKKLQKYTINETEEKKPETQNNITKTQNIETQKKTNLENDQNNTVNNEQINKENNKDNIINNEQKNEKNYAEEITNLTSNGQLLEQQNKEKMINQYEHEKPKIHNVIKLENEINTIWDILKIKENTQAEHLIKVIPSDQWVDMNEIKQRIKLEYNIEYKNEKSLYPYLKTLTDINLIKVNNTGKKRSWKKKIIIIE